MLQFVLVEIDVFAFETPSNGARVVPVRVEERIPDRLLLIG